MPCVSGVTCWYVFIVTVASHAPRQNETVLFLQINPAWVVSKTVSFGRFGIKSTL